MSGPSHLPRCEKQRRISRYNQQPIVEARTEVSTTTLKKRLAAMQEPTEGNEYYAITLTATEDCKLAWSTHSQFVGLTKTEPPRELRAASRVDGEKMLAMWRDLGAPGLVVDSGEDLSLFVLLGGNAIIEASLATEHLPEMLESQQFVFTGLVTMRLLDETDSSALRRAPTPRLRMQVLKRDNYRCRICGRRSADHVDVELHIHHFKPWAKGGLTESAT